jgi:putative NIF3 family GTP cyclohydrolase 1 type 2
VRSGGKNRQTFSFAFRTLKTEYQRAKSVKETTSVKEIISNIKPEAGQAQRAYGECLGIKGRRRAWQDCDKLRFAV